MVKTNAKKAAKYTMVNELSSKHARALVYHEEFCLQLCWTVLFFELHLRGYITLSATGKESILQGRVNEDFWEQGRRKNRRLGGEPLSVPSIKFGTAVFHIISRKFYNYLFVWRLFFFFFCQSMSLFKYIMKLETMYFRYCISSLFHLYDRYILERMNRLILIEQEHIHIPCKRCAWLYFYYFSFGKITVRAEWEAKWRQATQGMTSKNQNIFLIHV